MHDFSPLDFYRVIVQNYIGSILVVDHTGKICFTNQRSDFALPHDQLMNRTMQDLVKEGIYDQSSTLKTLSTKKREIEYVKRKGTHPIITTSVPIFDERGDLDYVIAYSLGEPQTYELVQRIESEKNHVLQVLSYITNTQNEMMQLVCTDPKMMQVVEYTKRVAASDSTVLLTGESGTGKEVLARYIHAHSSRGERVFIPVNCAAIPAALLETEIFGYEKGAFTGASANGKAGLFELAEKGTLFLDEIGEMPFSLQSKLLRVLDTGEFKRIGSEKIQKMNVRVLAATNRDLEDMVKKGKFRQDLYYRLNVIPIVIPPIRERKDDIIVLAEFFLQNLNKKYSTRKFLAKETIESLKQYSWPGNVREIKNVIERMYIAAPAEVLSLSFSLMPSEQLMATEPAEAEKTVCISEALPLKDAVRCFESERIQRALLKYGGNVTKAAQELGITRACLYKKVSVQKHHNLAEADSKGA